MWIYFIFTANMNEQSNSELLATVAFVVLREKECIAKGVCERGKKVR